MTPGDTDMVLQCYIWLVKEAKKITFFLLVSVSFFELESMWNKVRLQERTLTFKGYSDFQLAHTVGEWLYQFFF